MTTDGSQAAAPEPSPLAPPEPAITLTAPEAAVPIVETQAPKMAPHIFGVRNNVHIIDLRDRSRRRPRDQRQMLR